MSEVPLQGYFALRDLGSLNGTTVNGARLSEEKKVSVFFFFNLFIDLGRPTAFGEVINNNPNTAAPTKVSGWRPLAGGDKLVLGNKTTATVFFLLLLYSRYRS